MPLSRRTFILIFLIVAVTSGAHLLLSRYQEQALYEESEQILTLTVIQSLRNAIVQDVIDGNRLRITNLLRSLTQQDTPLEYLYVTSTTNTIFAHSFDNGFPKYLIQDDYNSQSASKGPSAKYDTDNGLVYQYSEPLIEGLDITLHLGINQSQIEDLLLQNSQVILLMSFIIVVLSVALGYYWNKQITSPLSLLTTEIQEFGSGQAIDQRKFSKSPPEIKLLLDSLIASTQKTEQMLVSLKESEAKFSQLVDNISLVFWLGSVDWHEVYYVSPAYETFWGHSSEELYADGLSWMNNIHPDDKEQVYDDIPKNINNIDEKIVTFRPYRVQKSDGSYIWVSAKAYPIFDDQGKVVRIAGIAQDITQYVDMEDTLKQTQKMDALGKLTGGIAHDFNNMLGVILGYTELLQLRLKEDPKLSHFANEIHQAGQRSANLTSKLLTFSRKRPTKTYSVNLNDLINERREMLEKTVTARIKVKLNLAEDLWQVKVDRGDFEDALVNMTINAIHAIEGSGEITITTTNTVLSENDFHMFNLTPGNYVEFTITDTGHGMTPEIRDRIFEPFYSTKGENGTGLGLAQVYGFVTQNNGEVYVYTEPGHGTRIVIHLPQHIKTSDEPKFSDLEMSGEHFRGTETILIVDDEPSLLELTATILETHGYKTIKAERGPVALNHLKSGPVDLVLSDVIMPEMDGYQLADEIKQKYPEMKILLTSGFTDHYHSEHINSELHQKLLVKPFTSINLLRAIRTELDS